MDENRYYYKQNTFTSNASDDSSCSFSLPWLTDTRKRRSRLGKHGRTVRVLQDINNQNNVELLDENDEQSHKPSDKASVSLDYTKPTDTDTDSHDVGFMKSNDALDTSFTQPKTNPIGISFSNMDTVDLMDISVSKADTNHDVEFIDSGQFSSPDEMRLNQRTGYSPELRLKTSNHSSFENDVLNLHRNSYSSEFLLNGNLPPLAKPIDVFNPPRPALPIDMVLSDYSSMMDDASVERNRSPARAVDLVMKNNNYVSPKNAKPVVSRRTPFPADLVLKTNDYDSPKENIPPASMDEIDSRVKSSYLSPMTVDRLRTSVPTGLLTKSNDYTSPKDNLIVPDSCSSLFSIDFVSKKNNDHSSPREQLMSIDSPVLPMELVTKKNDRSSPRQPSTVKANSPQFPVPLVTKKNDHTSPLESVLAKPISLFPAELILKRNEDTSSNSPLFPVPQVTKKNDHSSSLESILAKPISWFPDELIMKRNEDTSPKETVVPDPPRPSFPAEVLPKTHQPPLNKNPPAFELPSRTPFSTEPLQKANQGSPKRREISNPIPEVFPKSSQIAVVRPVENCDVEFKQPEAIRPAKKDDFQFEAPLPPPVFKINEKLPPFITVKGKSYTVTNVLGSGGSSMVYQVLHPEHGEILAIKQVKLSEVDESIAEGYIDEVKLLKKLQKCESIIKMYDHEIICENNKKFLNVVMERGDTDLAELLKNVNKYKKPSIYMILYYWTEMLSAVFEIHNEGIIHSDLKPANFLIVNGRLKLIDFGIASSMQGDMTSVYKDVFTGTLNYMSPEAVQFVNCAGGSIGYRITYKTDVWSLGCILYHLIYGRLPFQHLKKKWDKMRAIVDPKLEIECPEVKGVPIMLMTALKSCLDKDPKKRMSVGQLLQLPYCGN